MRTVQSKTAPRTTRRALLACTIVCAATLAVHVEAQTLRIGAFDAARSSAFFNLVTGGVLEDLRESLTDPDVLKVLGFDHVEFVGTSELTADFLSGVDMALIHNVRDGQNSVSALSAAEQHALRGFVLDGGAAFMAVDFAATEAAQSFVEPFDLEITGTIEEVDVSAIVIPKHTIMVGPFGEVDYVRTFWGGWFTELGVAAPLATLGANGQPSVVAIEPGAFKSGSGPVVAIADTNPFADSGDATTNHFNEHRVFFLNIVAWLTSPRFTRGDANDDGEVNVADPVHTLNFLFAGGPAPLCADAADANDDGDLNVADPVYVLNFLFADGPAPLAPYPGCGVDPTADELPECEPQEPCS